MKQSTKQLSGKRGDAQRCNPLACDAIATVLPCLRGGAIDKRLRGWPPGRVCPGSPSGWVPLVGLSAIVSRRWLLII